MSNIEICELNPSGVELFKDSESYLAQLNEAEMTNVVGGFTLNLEVNASNGASINSIGNTAIANSINGNTIGNDVGVFARF